MSGVDVKIILPGRPDKNKIMLSINRFVYGKRLEANIEIYEYNGVTHWKAVIIGDDVTILGSNTLGMRSLSINFETAIMVRSHNRDSQTSNNFQLDISKSNFFCKGDLHEFYTTKEKFKRYFIDVFYGVL